MKNLKKLKLNEFHKMKNSEMKDIQAGQNRDQYGYVVCHSMFSTFNGCRENDGEACWIQGSGDAGVCTFDRDFTTEDGYCYCMPV